MKAQLKLTRVLLHTALVGVVVAVGCGGSDQSTQTGMGGPNPNNPPCSSDGNCSQPLPYCNLSAHVCVRCLADANCSFTNARPYCSSAGTCVQCVANTNCGAGTTCDMATGQCRQTCGSNADCDPTTGRPYCSGGVCVQCVGDANCSGERPYCDVPTGQCVGCITNANCPAGAPYCATDRGRCAECLTDGNCPAGQRCQSDLTCG